MNQLDFFFAQIVTGRRRGNSVVGESETEAGKKGEIFGEEG